MVRRSRTKGVLSGGHLAPGFTLVELLVVIGIIALLISILLPVLSKAQEQARRVACLSNQHQVMQSMIMYTNDNKQLLPVPPRIGDTAPGSTPELRSLAYYCPTAGFIDYEHGALWPYVSAGQGPGVPAPTSALVRVFNCPSDTDNRQYLFGNRNFSFSWNGELSPEVPVHVRRLTEITQTSHKILLLEERLPNDGYAFMADHTWSDADDPAFHHRGGGCFGFADGHAEYLLPSDLGFSVIKSLVTPATITDYPRLQSYFNLPQGR